jgi:hypothetical protein
MDVAADSAVEDDGIDKDGTGPPLSVAVTSFASF